MEPRAVERDCYRRSHRRSARTWPIRHGRRSYTVATRLAYFGVGSLAVDSSAVGSVPEALPGYKVSRVDQSGLIAARCLAGCIAALCPVGVVDSLDLVLGVD